VTEGRSTTDELIAAAKAASFAWAPEAESLFQAAVKAACEEGDSFQRARGWGALGAYLFERARNESAVLAYAAARREGQQTRDAECEKVTLIGILVSLNELGDEAGALAARLLVGLVTEKQWAQLSHRMQQQLQNPESVLEASIAALRNAIPDFERRFLDGHLRFDRPEDVADVFSRRAEHGKTALTTTAWKLEQRAHARQFFHRLIWPALPLIAVAVAFTVGWLDIGRWFFFFGVLSAAVIYLLLWSVGIRAAWRWVNANRKMKSAHQTIEALAKAASTHDQALLILERFARDRQPFALYLRSFEGEAFESLTPKGVTRLGSTKDEFVQNAVLEGLPAGGYIEADQWVTGHQGGLSTLEKYLSEHLLDLIPVVTIANPAALHVRARVPRFEVENEAWPVAVRLLLGAAHFIVIEPARASPGVIKELELVKNSNRAADTIVVLPSPKTRSDMDTMRQIAASGFGQPVGPTTEFTGLDIEALEGFARVVDDEVFGDRDPASLLVFSGLLPEGPPASPEQYGKRRRERIAALEEAISLYIEAQAHVDGSEPAKAIELFKQAAEIFGRTGDLAQQAMPLHHQGRAWQALADLGKAASCFTAAAEIQRETGPPREYIGSIHHLALVLLETGAHATARATFNDMLSESRRWQFKRGEARAVEGLGLCALATDDQPGAADYMRQALQLSDDPRYQSTLAQALAAIEQKLGKDDAVAEWLRVAAEKLRAVGEEEAAISVLRDRVVASYNAAVVDLERGEVRFAVARLNEALTASRELGTSDLEQTILFRLGMAYSRAGQNTPAIEALQQSIELSRRAGEYIQTALTGSNIGTLLVRDGRIEEGIKQLNEAEQTQRALGDDSNLVWTVEALGDAYFRVGQYSTSLTWDEEALRLHCQHNNESRITNVIERIGLAHLYLERYAEAKPALLDAAERHHKAGATEKQAAALALAGQASAKLGESGDASQLFEQSAVLWESLGNAAQATQIRGLASRIG
jgi:tetratricopeptide (TPR) repeat protein